MSILMFDKQFVPLIKNGQKRSTIRSIAKCKAGDHVDLRCWSGKPYRSKMEQIEQVEILSVRPIRFGINHFIFWYDEAGQLFVPNKVELGKREGFKDHHELIAYVEKTYGLPFDGILIDW